MHYSVLWTRTGALLGLISLVLCHFQVPAQSATPPRQFAPGSPWTLEDLPKGLFRTSLEQLPEAARERAVGWLRKIHFTELDAEMLRVDSQGGVYYADHFSLGATPPTAEGGPVTSEAAVPVSPFPAGLKFHSRPGAPNIIYLDLDGETVTGTAWNSSLGRTSIPAVPFSTDSDYSTYSDTEQTAIKRIWERVAEDYAPFNVDVTTERPATFTTRTAHALITRNTDTNGAANPSSTAGGVAYVNVFADSLYANYRPAWIYFNNLANEESYIAEAASHEVGHNMGLSHDGTTSQAYYGGHGTGDISWGPLMGTGYDRNVSQWSKGEYYQSNNTEDDLAIISGKLTFRTDDHGDTFAAATTLRVTNGTNVVSTTPDTDPTNTNTYNKGVIQRNTDVDVFTFTTGPGSINLTVRPWIMPTGSYTRGGNLDVVAQLYNQQGTLLLTNNPATTTSALIATNLAEGVYFLRILNTGTGTPLSASPSGYTSYGSIGQYFISGTVRPSSIVIPPQAVAQLANLTQSLTGPAQFTVTYSDNVGINASTLSDGDVRVTGPGGYDRTARFVSVDVAGNGTPRTATYAIDPPDNVAWTLLNNGVYTVWMQTNQVSDTEGAWVAAGQLGPFSVDIPNAVYTQHFDSNPGWTFGGQWAYGPPAYTGSGPVSGFTGTSIVGYNLSGTYANRLTAVYATTPAFDCTGASSLTLRFYRWLGLKGGDTAVIQVSTNGTTWVDVWLAGSAVADTGWLQVQYALPSWVNNSPSVRLRWGMGSNNNQNDIGWNIDDVEVIAGGTLDTTAPVATLSIADVTLSGSPSHSLSVTYTDDTAIKVSTLGDGDLYVTGPNGFSNSVTFAGSDVVTDGTPRTASYSLAAPGGTWDNADNGTYQVTLRGNEVTDTSNNGIAELLLGSFAVSIPSNVLLTVAATPAGWGTVTPPSGTFAAGTTLPLQATPATYYAFKQWSGGVSGGTNPISLTLWSNLSVTAEFQEIFTTNYPTPHWWLASYGYTNNFESAVTNTGANGMLLWQSYVAGLTPTNPASQLLLQIRENSAAGTWELNWQAVTGRVYTIHATTNLTQTFTPLAGAVDMPATVTGMTNALGANPAPGFYKLSVRKL
jgi:hypothetical protein